MTTPKYSVVLPVLNGMETLSLTLPQMLRIERDDVEWVISDNHSDDSLDDFVRGLNDPRIKLCRPPQRLPLGKHLEFAYLNATGLWQGHLGDDDFLMPSRFDILDKVISDCPGVPIIRGEGARYVWPNYPVDKEANRLIPGKWFTGTCRVEDSKAFARRSLNQFTVYGGGSWVIHQDVIDKVRDRAGYFSSPQNVEFFAMRAAAAVGQRIALLDIPIFILGRSSGSAGSSAFVKDNASQPKPKVWNWSFEAPGLFEYCPYQYKGYGPVSMDGAMRVADLFRDELGEGLVDKYLWGAAIRSDLEQMISIGKVSPALRGHLRDVENSLPVAVKIRLAAHRLQRRIFNGLPTPIQNKIKFLRETIVTKEPGAGFGWANATDANEAFGAKNIVELAYAMEYKYKTWFSGLK